MISRPSLLLSVLLVLGMPAWAAKKVDLDYQVRFLPDSDQAEVSLRLEKGEAVRSLDFELGADSPYSEFKADGQWQPDESGARAIWLPAAGKATLSYLVRISHQRECFTSLQPFHQFWNYFSLIEIVQSCLGL